jgi:hypothetical protein
MKRRHEDVTSPTHQGTAAVAPSIAPAGPGPPSHLWLRRQASTSPNNSQINAAVEHGTPPSDQAGVHCTSDSRHSPHRAPPCWARTGTPPKPVFRQAQERSTGPVRSAPDSPHSLRRVLQIYLALFLVTLLDPAKVFVGTKLHASSCSEVYICVVYAQPLSLATGKAIPVVTGLE